MQKAMQHELSPNAPQTAGCPCPFLLPVQWWGATLTDPKEGEELVYELL